MVTRTAKIMGAAYSTGAPVNITVDYNGVRVFAGEIPTTTVDLVPIQHPDSDPNWEQELGRFETDTDATGNIPATITVTGGTVFYGHFWMNYIGPLVDLEQTDPDIPINLEDPTTFIQITVADTASNYGDPNITTVDTDGITNTKLNGNSWTWRVAVGDQLSTWAYPVRSGDVFEFDFYVDPARIVLTNE